MEYKDELNIFEEKLSEHCNYEYDNAGEEVINNHLSAVMIAFEEYYRERVRQNDNNNEELPI